MKISIWHKFAPDIYPNKWVGGAERMIYLLDNDDECRRLGNNTWSHSIRKFDMNRYEGRINRIYSKL